MILQLKHLTQPHVGPVWRRVNEDQVKMFQHRYLIARFFIIKLRFNFTISKLTVLFFVKEQSF